MESEGNKRKKSKKIVLTCVVGLFTIMLCCWVYHSLWFTRIMLRRLSPSNRTRLHLHISEIDHEELLDACRKEIARRELYPATTIDGQEVPGCVSPASNDDPRLSSAIRVLRAEPIIITARKLRADLHQCTGSCAHYGFVAFAPGVDPKTPDDLIDTSLYTCQKRRSLNDGAIEVVPGLWYYDNELLKRPGLRDLLARFIRKTRAKRAKNRNEQ